MTKIELAEDIVKRYYQGRFIEFPGDSQTIQNLQKFKFATNNEKLEFFKRFKKVFDDAIEEME